MKALQLVTAIRQLLALAITTCCFRHVGAMSRLFGVEYGSHLAQIYLGQLMSQTPLAAQNQGGSEGSSALYQLQQFQGRGPVISQNCAYFELTVCSRFIQIHADSSIELMVH